MNNPPDTTMISLKKQIIDAAIKKQTAVVDDFRQRIKDLMKTDGNVNEEEYDSQVQAQKSESIEEVSLLSDQLTFAVNELDSLQQINPHQRHAAVGFGSVVVTNKGTFFVAASVEAFEVDGKKMFGLTVRSPLYKSMEEKRVGDRFMFGGTIYHIREIF